MREIIFHTVPSTYVNERCRQLPTPYRRVVAIDDGSGPWWAQRDGHPATDYNRSDAAAEAFEVNDAFTARLLSFFDRYFARPDQLPSAHPAKPVNCHRFAYWMRGHYMARSYLGLERPPHLPGATKAADSPLPLGGHAVVGSLNRMRDRHVAIHSLVSLGETVSDCIQVVAFGGFLALDSYHNILTAYQTARPELQTQLFAAPAPAEDRVAS